MKYTTSEQRKELMQEYFDKYNKNNKLYFTEIDEWPGRYILWDPHTGYISIKNGGNYFCKSDIMLAIEDGFEIVLNKLPD